MISFNQPLSLSRFKHNYYPLKAIAMSTLLMVLASCSITNGIPHETLEPSASEQAAHERELAAIEIYTVVTESTNHSIAALIENNPEAKVLEACANRTTESIPTSLFKPVFDEGYVIALKEAAAQLAQDTPSFPFTDAEVKEITLTDIFQILDFYCEGWLAEQAVSPIN